MRKAGIITAVLVVALAGVVVASIWRRSLPEPSPRDRMPPPVTPVDHAHLITGPIATGPEATRACLSCHPDAASELMKTAHWTWAGHAVKPPGSDEIIHVGKRNLINNFCIYVGPNVKKCASCHVGYGWKDDTFDFAKEENVDCLVCHEQTGLYQKDAAGYPKPEVDLVTAAKSVGRPTRHNCGNCHFKGGGGNAVKHGDMDSTMFHPTARIDVHMGEHNLECVDCHRTVKHDIPGCTMAMAIDIDPPRRVACTDCHSETPHNHDRLDAHTRTVACQTCHIPRMAIDAPTKMHWDWSAAGQDGREEDVFSYMKKKGRFEYAQNIRPEYHWYNGQADRYLPGDKVDPDQLVAINQPQGGPDDPEAKIWPFKVHRGKQIYDRQHRYLLTPNLSAPGGFWTEFDWDKACRLGSEQTGLPYSGEYGFVETEMYWPLSHMVQSEEKALQCVDCHGEQGILDWESLGYGGDPAYRGNRRRLELLRDEQGGGR